MSVTRTPLCTVAYCPAKTSPDWHHCLVCESPEIQHHHVDVRGMGGSKSRRDDPDNVVPLCEEHHRRITLNEWGNAMEWVPGSGLTYWIWDLHGKTIVKHVMDGEMITDESELHGSNPPPEEGSVRTGTGGRRGDRRGDEGEIDSRSLERDGGSGVRATGLQERAAVLEELTFDDWCRSWEQVAAVARNKAWWAGDHWAYAEDRFHDRLYQIGPELCEAAGLDLRTISNYANVCRAFPPERRTWPLSFAHYAAVYTQPESDQESLLDKAVVEHLTSTELRALARPESAQRAKRWSIEELRELRHGFVEQASAKHEAAGVLGDFLEWIEAKE